MSARISLWLGIRNLRNGKVDALMRLFKIVLITALVLVAAAACTGGSNTSYKPEFRGGARIVFDKDSLDLGDVPPGKTVEAVFKFRNVGDADLVIDNAFTRVVEGCCPSQPEIDVSKLAPGKSGSLTLRMVMGKGMGGPHVFEVQVLSNDLAQPETHLNTKAVFLE